MNPILLFSDVHGRSQRLKFLLRFYPTGPAICLGDAVGMGDNDSTLAQLRERQVECIAGNHDTDMIELYEVNPEHRAWIKTWPYRKREDDILFSHSWLEGRQFHRIDSIYAAESMFQSEDFRVAFVGHSHSPGWWEWSPGDRPRWTHANQAREVKWELGKRYIVDVGSLGEPQMPGDPVYALWDKTGVRWLGL